MLQEIKVKLIGVCPMLTHNCQLADPLNEYAKELKKVSSKRSKTDEDHAAMAEIEFMGGLYLDDKEKPILPSEVVEATIIGGAKKERMGPAAKAAVFVMEDFKMTKYDGPKNIKKRMSDTRCFDRRLVRVQANKVARTRPKYTNWEAQGVITFDNEQVDEDVLLRWLETAGQQLGVGDYRPKFGRFEVKVL